MITNTHEGRGEEAEEAFRLITPTYKCQLLLYGQARNQACSLPPCPCLADAYAQSMMPWPLPFLSDLSIHSTTSDADVAQPKMAASPLGMKP